MSQTRGAEWGNILKSNSNGTYYGLSLPYVNRNDRGYVDFEKLIGLDGIALVNVVSNYEEAAVTGKKVLQSRITHNDGGTWKPLTPPAKDSLGQKYKCSGAVGLLFCSHFNPSLQGVCLPLRSVHSIFTDTLNASTLALHIAVRPPLDLSWLSALSVKN